jgi:tetratricopeptide (TPR) repeat protein
MTSTSNTFLPFLPFSNEKLLMEANKNKEAGNYKSALAQYLELLDRDYKAKEQKNILIYCYDIAICLENLHEYEESIKYLKEVLVGLTIMNGERDKSTAVILNDLGRLYSRAGMPELGLDNCKKAEEILTKSLGPNHPEVLTAQSTIADIHYKLRNFDKALEIVLKLISIQESKGPEQSVSVGLLYHKLGNIYQALNDNEKAIFNMKKGVIYYGDSKKIDLAIMYSDLASAYEVSGEKELALENFFKSLEITEIYAHENPVSKIDALNKIARTYSRLGENISAIQYIQSALKVAQEHFGDTHFYIGLENNMLGILYERLGDYKASFDYFEKAIAADIKSGGYGANSADIISSQGRIMALMGNPAQGIENCNLALNEIKKFGAQDTTEGAKVYYNLGKCQAIYGENSVKVEAIKNMSLAYDKIKKIFGLNELWLGYIGQDLAVLHYENGNKTKAIEILAEVFKVYKIYLGPKHNSVKEAIALAKAWNCSEIVTFT